MHLNDLGRLRRFVSACFVVLRRNCTWAELGCFVPSAEATKQWLRRWAQKSVWEHLMQHSQPMAEPDVLQMDSTGDFAKRNADIKRHHTETGARGGGEEVIGRSRGGLTTKIHHAADSLGFVRHLLTSPGQHADCRRADRGPAAGGRSWRQELRQRQVARPLAGTGHRRLQPVQAQPPGPARLRRSPLPHPAHDRELLLPLEGPSQAQPAPGQDRHQLPRLRLLRRSPHEPQTEAETLSLDPNLVADVPAPDACGEGRACRPRRPLRTKTQY